MPFVTVRFKNEQHMDGQIHPPHLINVVTLPCKSQNTENAYEHKFGF